MLNVKFDKALAGLYLIYNGDIQKHLLFREFIKNVLSEIFTDVKMSWVTRYIRFSIKMLSVFG